MFKYVFVVLVLSASVLCAANEPDSKTFVIGAYYEIPDELWGSELVHEYMAAQAGYRLQLKIIPAKRMEQALRDGIIDAMPANNKHSYDANGLIEAAYPYRVYSIHLYRKKTSDWEISWPPNEAFRQAKGVTIHHNHLAQLYNMNLTQIAKHEAGIQMVNLDRADYWLDLIPIGRYENLLRGPSEGYEKLDAFDQPASLVFRDDDRGRALKKSYDDELIKLLNNQAEYKRVFSGENDYSDDPVLAQLVPYLLNYYLNFMNKKYSEFTSNQ